MQTSADTSSSSSWSTLTFPVPATAATDEGTLFPHDDSLVMVGRMAGDVNICEERRPN
ncbi:protein of unknown function [Magnetospirillum sp. XM-1]|nr:protein of unknown function [Magnetospirillum sp. XM-1]